MLVDWHVYRKLEFGLGDFVHLVLVVDQIFLAALQYLDYQPDCRASGLFPCLSAVYPWFIRCLSAAYPRFIRCLSAVYPPFIRCLSAVFLGLSAVYPLVIRRLSAVYPSFIRGLSVI